MKKVLLVIVVLMVLSVPCFADINFGSYFYENLMYAGNFEPFKSSIFFPGFNGIVIFGKYIHQLDNFELETGLDLGFVGYGLEASVFGGISKSFYLSEATIYRVSGDLAAISTFGRIFAVGCRLNNEFQQMFNENLGLGLLIGLHYKNYIFSIDNQNFIDIPIGLELVFR